MSKWAWEDENTPQNPRLEQHFQKSAAQSAASADFTPSIRPVFEDTPPPPPLDPADEVALANLIARKQFNRTATPRQSRQLAGDHGWANGMTPKADAQPKRPRPNTMTTAEQLAEIVNAWPKLKASDRSSLLGTLRRSPSIAGRTHVSKMAKATRGQHLVHHTEAAKLLGIVPGTLDAWYQRGWITGKIRVSGNAWYPKTEVTKARRLAEKRSKS